MEAESNALIAALDDWRTDGITLMSSSLTVVEVTRAIRTQIDELAPRDLSQKIEDALVGIMAHPIDAQVIDVARRLGPASLRSLDAIHLASATLLGADLVCAYDQRLLTAAEELGFRTVSPR